MSTVTSRVDSMPVQLWIYVMVFCVATFKSTKASYEFPDRSPIGQLIDSEFWKAPSEQTYGPLCVVDVRTQSFSEASHKACKIECLALSHKAEIVFKMYGNSRAAANTVSRQCSGFVSGQCKSTFLGYFPMCWCLGKDFRQASFLCRTILLEWLRTFINTKTRVGNIYNSIFKPQTLGLSFLDNLKYKAIRLLGTFEGNGSHLDNSIHVPQEFDSAGFNSEPFDPTALLDSHGLTDEHYHRLLHEHLAKEFEAKPSQSSALSMPMKGFPRPPTAAGRLDKEFSMGSGQSELEAWQQLIMATERAQVVEPKPMTPGGAEDKAMHQGLLEQFQLGESEEGSETGSEAGEPLHYLNHWKISHPRQ